MLYMYVILFERERENGRERLLQYTGLLVLSHLSAKAESGHDQSQEPGICSRFPICVTGSGECRDLGQASQTGPQHSMVHARPEWEQVW